MVHIGKVIQQLVKHRGLKVSEFAKKVNCSRRTIYDVFERDSIDTKLLQKISAELGENLFFKFISNQEIEAHLKKQNAVDEIRHLVNTIKQQAKRLNEKDKQKLKAEGLELTKDGVRLKNSVKKQTKKKSVLNKK